MNARYSIIAGLFLGALAIALLHAVCIKVLGVNTLWWTP